MTTLVSLFMQPNSFGSTPSQDVFGITPVQKLVKDEVVFAPAQNPYHALNKAAEKLSAGQNIFSVTPTPAKQVA